MTGSDVYLFICYSSKDIDVVRDLVAAIESGGFKCWYAKRDLAAGRNFGQQIYHAIQGAFGFVYVHSQNAASSTHVTGELYLAKDRDCQICPISIDNFELGGDLRYLLAGVTMIVYQRDPSECAKKVTDSLVAWILG